MADGSVIFEILADETKFKQAVAGLGKSIEGALDTASSSIAGAGTALTVGVTAPLAAAGVAATKWALDTASAAEQADIALSTMLGPEKAQQMLSDLADFARTTPFEMSGLTSATQKLLAYGFAAEDVIPLLTSVGNATAGLGAGQEGIDAVTRALGQMQAKGKVMSEEMLQLTEVGIPAWQYLADALGTDVAGAQDKVTKGAVDATTAISVLQAGMDRDFGGLMAKQAETLTGALSNLVDSAEGAARELYKTDSYKGLAGAVANLSEGLGPLAEKLMPSVEAAVGLAAGAVEGLTGAIGSLSQSDVNAIVGGLGLLAGLGPGLLATSGALSAAADAASALFPAASAAADGMQAIGAAATKGLPKAASALGNLGAALSLIKESPLQALQSAMGGVAARVGDAGAALQLFAENPAQSVKSVLGEIASAASKDGSVLSKTLAQSVTAASAVAAGMGTASVAVGALGLALGAAATLFAAGGGNIMGAAQDISSTLLNLSEAGASALSGLAGAIPDAVSGLASAGPWVANAVREALSTMAPAAQEVLAQLPSLMTAGVSALLDVVVASAPMLLDGALQLFGALLTGLAETVPLIAEQLPVLVTSLGEVLIANAPMLLIAAGQFFLAIAQALPAVIPSLVAQIPLLVESVSTALPTFLPMLLAAAVNLFVGIVQAVPQVLPQLLSAAASLIGSVVANIPSFVGQLLAAAVTLFLAIATAVPQAAGEVLSAIGSMLSDIWNEITSFDLFSAGTQLIQGFMDGIASMAGSLISAVTGPISDAIAGAKSLLGIASPSKVFRGIGRYTGEGLELGLLDEEGAVSRAMGRLSSAIADGWRAPAVPSLAAAIPSGGGGRSPSGSDQTKAADIMDAAIERLGDRLERALGEPVQLTTNRREFGRLVREVS